MDYAAFIIRRDVEAAAAKCYGLASAPKIPKAEPARNRNRPGRHSAGAVLCRPYLIRCRVGGVVSTGLNGSFTVGL